MVQYQSFPGVPGDSKTLEKLKALRLPSLEGKRFLDVGCNEGFFCGYARFDGATRSVGIDASATFVSRARQRFPGCEFFEQSWAKLPEGPFDVILLASALHYAADQEALLRSLMDHLAPGGTLVLELGVVGRPKNEWVLVKRGADERTFPTMAKLHEILAPYAYKHMGPSVSQSGDPVRRFVVHVHQRSPFAYLLMQPPAYGKSTIARTLFRPAGVHLISGDDTVQKIANGAIEVSPALKATIEEGFSSVAIDQALARVAAAGLGDDLVRAMIARANGRDFALDAYLPPALHAQVEQVAREEGYVPVVLSWQPAGERPVAQRSSDAAADAFFASLAASVPGPSSASGSRPVSGSAPEFASGSASEFASGSAFESVSESAAGSITVAMGFVDGLRKLDSRVVRVRGWAFDDMGRAAETIVVRLAGATHEVSLCEKVSRPDVVKAHPITDPLVGYEVDIALALDASLEALVSDLEVRVRTGGRLPSAPLRISRRLLGGR